MCGVLSVIATLDDRVRQSLLDILRLEPSAVLSLVTGRTSQFIRATTALGGDNTPLVLFATAGIGLLALMLRR